MLGGKGLRKKKWENLTLKERGWVFLRRNEYPGGLIIPTGKQEEAG